MSPGTIAKLNIDAFPHIFDLVVSYVYASDDVATLSTLRQSGRAAKRSVDRQVATHMVVAGSRPCSLYYSVWSSKMAHGNGGRVRTIDVLDYDDGGSPYSDGVCAVFLRNARPTFLRVYGTQASVPVAPTLRALIQILSFAFPLVPPPSSPASKNADGPGQLRLGPKLHNVLCVDAFTATKLCSVDLAPCGRAHLTISLLPFFTMGSSPTDVDVGRVLTTLNCVIHWARDQLEQHPGLSLAILGIEKTWRGFAFCVDWNTASAQDDRILHWSEEVHFDMRADIARRLSLLSHTQFRQMYGDELHRLVVDT